MNNSIDDKDELYLELIRKFEESKEILAVIFFTISINLISYFVADIKKRKNRILA